MLLPDVILPIPVHYIFIIAIVITYAFINLVHETKNSTQNN